MSASATLPLSPRRNATNRFPQRVGHDRQRMDDHCEPYRGLLPSVTPLEYYSLRISQVAPAGPCIWQHTRAILCPTRTPPADRTNGPTVCHFPARSPNIQIGMAQNGPKWHTFRKSAPAALGERPGVRETTQPGHPEWRRGLWPARIEEVDSAFARTVSNSRIPCYPGRLR